VDITDLVLVARRFGEAAEGSPADVNGDGVVNIVDLVSVARRFGERVSASVAAKELPAETKVTLSLTTRPLGNGRMEVSVNAESSVPLGGYQMQIVSSDADVVLERLEPGDLLGTNVYWLTPSQRSNEMTGVAVRLDENGAPESRGTLARLVLRSTARMPERIEEIVQLRDVRFSDREGNYVGYRYAVPAATNPASFRNALYANYPNPFNPETWIPFSLAEASEVTLRIFDVNGRLVREIPLGYLDAGDYIGRERAAHWDGRNTFGERVASGVYFYQLNAGSFTQTRRLLVVK